MIEDSMRKTLDGLCLQSGATADINYGHGYPALVNHEEDAELILMRIGTDDEGEYMDIVDDDEELITVGKVFEERLRAMYDIDDSELQ